MQTNKRISPKRKFKITLWYETDANDYQLDTLFDSLPSILANESFNYAAKHNLSGIAKFDKVFWNVEFVEGKPEPELGKAEHENV